MNYIFETKNKNNIKIYIKIYIYNKLCLVNNTLCSTLKNNYMSLDCMTKYLKNINIIL